MQHGLKKHGLNVSLLVVLALLTALNWGLGRDTSERGIEFVPEMVHAVSAEAYSASPVLAGGMTLQQPPEGTIPRGWPPLRLAATPEDALRAGVELENPFALDDPQALARGQVVFSRYCAVCHGPAGQGDGPVAQRGFPTPPPLPAPHARDMRDGQIFHIITFGQVNMPGYAAQLDREDRWRAVLRVREIQSEAPLIDDLPAEDLPADDLPADDLSVDDVPADDVPADDSSDEGAVR